MGGPRAQRFYDLRAATLRRVAPATKPQRAGGLYLPERTVGWEYYMRLALAAADEAFSHQMALTLVPTWPEGHAGPPLHVDGVIVSDPVLGSPMMTRLAGLGVPVVTSERDVTPGRSTPAASTATTRPGFARYSTISANRGLAVSRCSVRRRTPPTALTFEGVTPSGVWSASCRTFSTKSRSTRPRRPSPGPLAPPSPQGPP